MRTRNSELGTGKLSVMLGMLLLLVSCGGKPAPAPQMPDDFVALLDYRQLPSGKNFGTVFVVPNQYKGSITLTAQGKTEKITVKPGEIKEFAQAINLTVGDMLEVKSGDRVQQIKIKYDTPQQVSLGFVDTPAAMFNDKTPFYATKSGGNYISLYHIAKTPDASLGYPSSDTLWYAMTFKNKITVKDTDGMDIVKVKPLVPKTIYYITSYFYDMDYNYLGGSMKWEAKYWPE